MSDEVQNIDDPELRKLLHEIVAVSASSFQRFADDVQKAADGFRALGEAAGKLRATLEATLDAMLKGDEAAPPT